MTPLALFQISGRIGLFLFGFLSLWVGIFITLIYDRLPQGERLQKLFPWSPRFRLWLVVVVVTFSVGMMVFAVKVPAQELTSTDPGLLAGCSTPFWVACGIAWVRYTISELRVASRLRRQQIAERAAKIDFSNSHWTDD